MSERAFRVFYSWQSDRPNSLNRGFIEDSLKKAAKAIGGDESIEVDLVLDRDTQGVAGSPDISMTIFDKIKKADVFVADITIVHDGGEEGRRAPNPNVLVELGYALRALSWERTIMVMNTAFGAIELLPFDLPRRRVTHYELGKEASKAPIRDALAKQLEGQLRTMLAHLEKSKPLKPDPIEHIVNAISSGAADIQPQLRSYMKRLITTLDEIAPQATATGHPDDALIVALEASLDTVVGYGRVVDTIARFNSEQAAQALYSGFEGMLERYDMRGAGQFRTTDFDFYKFLGHELFAMLIAALVSHDRLELIATLLEEPMVIETRRKNADEASFDDLSEYVRLLERRTTRLTLQTVSLHATLLKERHNGGDLAKVAPFEPFLEADFLLWLRQELLPEHFPSGAINTNRWVPWSGVFLDEMRPRFLAKASSRRYAARLLPVLALPDTQTFRARYSERAPRINHMFGERHPFFEVDLPKAESIAEK